MSVARLDRGQDVAADIANCNLPADIANCNLPPETANNDLATAKAFRI